MVVVIGKFGGCVYYLNYGLEVSLVVLGGNMNYVIDFNGILLIVNIGNFWVVIDSYVLLQGISMVILYVVGMVVLMKSLECSVSLDKIEWILKNIILDFLLNCGGCGCGLLNVGVVVKQMIGVIFVSLYFVLDLILGMWGLDGILQEFQGEIGIQYWV